MLKKYSIGHIRGYYLGSFQEYLTNHYVVGDFNGRPVVQIAINVESIMERMKIHNKKVNRKTFRNSIERLKSVSGAIKSAVKGVDMGNITERDRWQPLETSNLETSKH